MRESAALGLVGDAEDVREDRRGWGSGRCAVVEVRGEEKTGELCGVDGFKRGYLR